MTKEEVLRLRLQTASPWMRAVFVMLGSAGLLLAAICRQGGAPWWIVVLFATPGVATIAMGILGRREYLEKELSKLPAAVVDGVLNGLI